MEGVYRLVLHVVHARDAPTLALHDVVSPMLHVVSTLILSDLIGTKHICDLISISIQQLLSFQRQCLDGHERWRTLVTPLIVPRRASSRFPKLEIIQSIYLPPDNHVSETHRWNNHVENLIVKRLRTFRPQSMCAVYQHRQVSMMLQHRESIPN